MVFVQVPQNIPEPRLPTAQEVGEREVQMFFVLQYFVRACVWVLQIRQIKESKVVCPHLSYREGGWNPLGEIFTSLQKQVDLLVPLLQSPVLSLQTPRVQPGPNPAHRILQSTIWTYFTHKWQERNVIKNQRACIIFYFIMNCTGYCIFVQIKMSQTLVSFVCYSSIPVKPNVSHSVINTSLQK